MTIISNDVYCAGPALLTYPCETRATKPGALKLAAVRAFEMISINKKNRGDVLDFFNLLVMSVKKVKERSSWFL